MCEFLRNRGSRMLNHKENNVNGTILGKNSAGK